MDMVEVVSKKVLKIRFKSNNNHFFFLKLGRGKNIVDHPSIS
jgi:hypothetical protein